MLPVNRTTVIVLFSCYCLTGLLKTVAHEPYFGLDVAVVDIMVHLVSLRDSKVWFDMNDSIVQIIIVLYVGNRQEEIDMVTCKILI